FWALMWRWPYVWRSMPAMGLLFGLVLVMLALSWLDRLTSPRSGVWLLWMRREGVGVQTEFDPTSFVARARKWVAIIFFPLYFLLMFAPDAMPGRWVFPVVMGVGMLVFVTVVERTSRAKPAVKASGVQPILFAWESLSK